MTITATSAPAPVALQSFVAVELTGGGALDWLTANDPSHVATRIFRAEYASAYAGPFDIGDAALIATVYGAPNAAQSATDPSLAVGVYAYWAAPINSGGIEGTLSGPETFEIT